MRKGYYPSVSSRMGVKKETIRLADFTIYFGFCPESVYKPRLKTSIIV